MNERRLLNYGVIGSSGGIKDNCFSLRQDERSVLIVKGRRSLHDKEALSDGSDCLWQLQFMIWK